MNYLKGWFFVDLVAVLPIDTIVDLTQGGEVNHRGGVNQIVRLTRIGKIYRLIKITRLFRLLKV